MVEGTRVFPPIKLDKGRNVGVYAGVDRLVAGGLVWAELRTSCATRPSSSTSRSARATSIAFAEDPNFRAFTEATQLLFINAVVLGPAH